MKCQKPEIILTTPRLFLRTWVAEDIPDMALISSDPQVMEYFPYIPDLVATEQLINRFISQYEECGYAPYAAELKETGEFIGFVGLGKVEFEIPHFIPRGDPIVEIGWRLAQGYWGKGYATEAAKAVLNYAFEQLTLNEIISFTAKLNMRSRGVMEKIGLEHNAGDDFNHPNIAIGNILSHHVLYRITRNKYFTIE